MFTNHTLVPIDPKAKIDRLNIHSVESMGTYDGPGIRFVVFLQGCPFTCLYCANPDTIKFEDGNLLGIERLVTEASHMKAFFSNGGGVTVSGGEPCAQAKQLITFFEKLKKENIHTCLDTNGHILNHYVEDLLEVTDLVLLDVKHIDPTVHEKVTGRSNEKTLEFGQYLEDHNKPFWLRYVLVPGLTDDPLHLHQLGQHFEDYKQLKKVEIQPYHRLGVHKWKMLDMEYKLENTPENTPEQLAVAKDIFEQYFDEVVVN